MRLNAVGQLGGHQLPAVDPAPVDDEGPVADGVQRALLLACCIDAGGNRLQHHDVVLPDDVGDLALDVGEALLDQGRLDDLAPQRREPEPGELVRIRAGAGADADHLVQHVHRWNGDDALPVLAQGREGVVPLSGDDGECRREIHHHGPGDGHDVGPLPVMGRHQDNRSRFHQGEGLAQFQLAHGRSSRDAVGLYPGLAGTLDDCGAPMFKITGLRGFGGLMVWASLLGEREICAKAGESGGEASPKPCLDSG